jgi:hypothetical protein
MKLATIDPGTEKSAFVLWDGKRPTASFIEENGKLLTFLYRSRQGNEFEHIAIEGIQCQGMAVGAETFTTCIWIGRFIEAWGGEWSLVYRNEVKMHLCGSPRAKDPNIRQALIDKFGGESKAIGGVKCGTCKGVGTKGYVVSQCPDCGGRGVVPGARIQKNCPRCKRKGTVRGDKATCEFCRGSKWSHPPGPLHDIATHCWSALAVAVTFTEKRELAQARGA